jgi:hypothetical protein
MYPHWDPDNNVTWDAFFANRQESELAGYEGDGPPPVNNNEGGRRLWWGFRTLESVMGHIMADDYPRMRHLKNGGNGRGGVAIRELSSHLSSLYVDAAVTGTAHLNLGLQICSLRASTDLALTYAEAEALHASNYRCPSGYQCPQWMQS